MIYDSQPLSGPFSGLARAPRDAMLVAGIIFCAALFGILTRPVGFLAAFWPANAILLGIMIRQPRLAGLPGWLGAFVGYMAADLMTGGPPGLTLWLTAANMTEAATGYALFRLLPEDHRRLRWPQSIMYLFAICCCAAAMSSFVGAGATRIVYGRDLSTGLELWFSTELANTMVVLPAILTAPRLHRFRWPRLAYATPEGLRAAMPAISLLASILLGSLMSGPGSFAFPVPALLWCAVSYSLFTTSLLTLCFCMWGMMVVTGSFAELPAEIDPLDWGKSVRLALALIALAPLAVASINAARNELLKRLQDTVDHDTLTRALTRSTFIERSEDMLDRRHKGNPGTGAVLMLDVDRFKSVNDRYGHAAGDAALVAFARSVADALRAEDLFGRLGGEEFAVLLPNVTPDQAIAIAERIRHTVEHHQIDIGEGRLLSITVSGGLAFLADPETSLDAILALADTALYQAKTEGRNRIARSMEPQLRKPDRAPAARR